MYHTGSNTPLFLKLSVGYRDVSICNLLYPHPSPTLPPELFKPTYHICVLKEWLHLPIWVCLPRSNWIHRILDRKKILELFMSPSRASTKYSILYIISICWVHLLWVKLHFNLRTRTYTLKHINTNMPHSFINGKRCKFQLLCTASSFIE